MGRTKRRTHGEGTVYEKRLGYWTAQIRYQGQRITGSGATPETARRALAEKLAAIGEGGVHGARAEWTVGEFLNRWIAELRATESLKPSTWRRYEGIVRVYLVPGLGSRRLGELTKQDVAGLIQKARAGEFHGGRPPSETTLHHVHAVLRAGLETALGQGLLDRNVVRLVKGPSVRHRPKVILSRQEALSLIQATQGEPFGAAITLATATGMRQGEILGLRRGDLNLEAGRLFVSGNAQIGYSGERELVDPKTAAGRRSIKLPQVAIEALREHLARQDPPSMLVFPSSSGHLVPEWRFLRQHFYRILRKANLPKMPFHDLRHSAATLLKEMDVDLVTISHILGHSSPAITMKLYGHVTPTLEQRAAERMDGALGAGTAAATRAARKTNGSQMAAKIAHAS